MALHTTVLARDGKAHGVWPVGFLVLKLRGHIRPEASTSRSKEVTGLPWV
jgi:hypothetical protein